MRDFLCYRQPMKKFRSDLSGKQFPETERIPGASIRESILSVIQRDYPNFTREGDLALSELNTFREKYISEYLARQVGELSELEKTVVTAIKEKKILSEDEDDGAAQNLTFGQRIADKVAEFGGSWTFILSFGAFLAVWIGVNVTWLAHRAFDPYPFILLNLILSTIAALQAPVIMMSQNRQEEKDRERAKKDYMINLKSELEIRMLHEKIDHLIMYQQQEVIEVQKVQVQMMTDILKRVGK